MKQKNKEISRALREAVNSSISQPTDIQDTIKSTKILPKKNWAAKDKVFAKFVLKMKCNSYWKQSGPGWERYILFTNPQADVGFSSIKGWSKSVLVDLNAETVRRELLTDWGSSEGYTFDPNLSIAWRLSTKDRFDFWWSLGSNPSPGFS